jgi:hypothetical protein
VADKTESCTLEIGTRTRQQLREARTDNRSLQSIIPGQSPVS